MDQQIHTIRNYQRLVADLRRRLVATSLRAWTSRGTYHRTDVDAFLHLVIPQLIAGRATTAQLTDVYLSKLTNQTPQGIDPALLGSLRGVPDEVVYARPFQQTWRALAKGNALDTAIDAGMVRLVSLIETDIQLAKQHQEQATLTRSKVKFYRRALTGAENCALCVVASTQRYRVGVLSHAPRLRLLGRTNPR
ncbi:MAG: hypothetical protein V9G04_08905 [Nocardioides sp.]|jgi:hypothetical protein